MSRPLISVIMASFNHADYIGEAIRSVQKQDYSNWELLIADDGSSDNTLEVLEAFADDPRIRIFPFQINREYHMRNFAAQQAKGEYIAFLNSDDVFFAHKLSLQVEVLKRSTQVAAVFTFTQAIDQDGQGQGGHPLKIFSVENKSRHEWLNRFFMRGNCLCLSSAMMRRSWFKQTGGFNPSLIQIADLDLWIKTCFQHQIFVIPILLTGMRIHESNLSASNSTTFSRLFVETQQVYARYFAAEGLRQAGSIFPGLMKNCPEGSEIWQRYLLARTASFQQNHGMRHLGFMQQHALFASEKNRRYLQKNNPRLMRTFYMSEGSAGLGENQASVNWSLYLSSFERREESRPFVSQFTGPPNNNPVCLSLRNPRTSEQLYLKIAHRKARVRCSRIRLYNQQNGELIAENTPQMESSTDTKEEVCALPKVDLAACPSEWIDIEIDSTCTRS